MSSDNFLDSYIKVKEEHTKIEYAVVNNRYTPREHSDYSGYFIIPGDRYKNHLIDLNGNVIILVNTLKRNAGERITKYIDKQGYFHNTLYVDKYDRPNIGNHVLVCLAFWGSKPFPDAEVNHHDGNKQNNHYSNLYWTTPNLNIKHANDFNLSRHDYSKVPVLLWDPINDPDKNDIKEYESIRAASIAIGINFSSISITLKLPKPRLVNSRYIAKYKDDNIKWPNLDEVFKNSQTRPVYGYNVTTKEILSDITAKGLSKQINMCYETVKRSLKDTFVFNNSGWLFSYKRNEDWETLYKKYLIINKEKIENKNNNEYKLFFIIDLNTGIKYADDSVAYISSYLNLDKYTITQYLRNQWYKYKDYLIYYYEDNSDKLKEIKTKYIIK